MAKDTSKTGKSETLTIRLDQKTRFILEYVSRLKGQTITTVVERAIVNSASEDTVPDREFGGNLNWQDFWDVSEGVRFLKLAARNEFFPTYEDDRTTAFCKEHWPFFWSTSQRRGFLNHYIDVLWPRIEEFIALHDEQKSSDYFAAGRAMQEALSNAKLKAPVWPIPDKGPPTPDGESGTRTSGRSARELDDDIPF